MKKKFLLLLLGAINCFIVNAQTNVVDSVIYDGVWRNYRLFLPAGFTTITPLPLVFNLHGYTSNAIQQEAYSGFDDVADSAQVIMCYPNGLNNAWSIIANSPDIGFIDTLITILHNQYNINLDRVYSTGLSNGGFLSNLLGCELSNRIAAIAPVAGTNIPSIQSSCNPSRKVPVLYIHGTADPVVEYNGTTGYSSAADLMNLWSNIDGCSITTDTVQLTDISTTDGCTAQRITWHDCDSTMQVIHYRIVGGGHTWPGAPINIGVTNHDFDASKIIWEFFNQFTLRTGIEDLTANNYIRISPNPFDSEIKIELLYHSKSIVKIFSPDGKLIISSEHLSSEIILNAGELSEGIYFLNVTHDDVSETFKLIKI